MTSFSIAQLNTRKSSKIVRGSRSNRSYPLICYDGGKKQLPGQCISLSNICVNGGGITYFIGKEGVISCGVGSSGISFR